MATTGKNDAGALMVLVGQQTVKSAEQLPAYPTSPVQIYSAW